MPSMIVTPDICDAYPDVKVLEPLFLNLGGPDAFYGPVRTVKCFEDNSRVKEAVGEPGDGAVLVVDGPGGSGLARSLAHGSVRHRRAQDRRLDH